MTHDSTNQHLSLEPDYDGFDPLEDFEDDATEVEGRADEFVATVSAAEDALAHDAVAPAAPAICEKPAEERIADLLEAMAPRRTVLLGILAACAEPQPASAVSARVDELQENNFSVYSAANLCSLLEKAGAIERVTAEGEPAEDIEVEPQTVVVDGVEYLEAREPVEIYWRITEPGRTALEADKPLERLRALLDGPLVGQDIACAQQTAAPRHPPSTTRSTTTRWCRSRASTRPTSSIAWRNATRWPGRRRGASPTSDAPASICWQTS